MRKLDKKGVAAVTLVIIAAASMGAAMATPLIVDAADVDPDSPFYGLERLGERIQRVGDEDQMKERWGEYQRMVAKGKGVGYQAILEEFRDEMGKILESMPENVNAKKDIILWMQRELPGIGEVRLDMLQEVCERVRENVWEHPEIGTSIQGIIGELENLRREIPTAAPEQMEQVRARTQILWGRMGEITERCQYQKRHVYENIDNILVNIGVTINAEVNITIAAPPIDLSARFDEKLAEFDGKLAEVQTKIGELQENSYLKSVVEALVSRAATLRDQAVGLKTTNPRLALSLLFRANVLLNQAEMIIEHAAEWVPE